MQGPAVCEGGRQVGTLKPCNFFFLFNLTVRPKTTLALTVRPRTTLALAVRPKITLANKLYVEREQTASLNCVVEGNPIPSIQWSPCDLPRICCNGQHLSISRVQTSRAYYTCTAVNNLGSDSRTTVLSKFQGNNLCLCYRLNLNSG